MKLVRVEDAPSTATTRPAGGRAQVYCLTHSGAVNPIEGSAVLTAPYLQVVLTQSSTIGVQVSFTGSVAAETPPLSSPHFVQGRVDAYDSVFTSVGSLAPFGKAVGAEGSGFDSDTSFLHACSNAAITLPAGTYNFGVQTQVQGDNGIGTGSIHLLLIVGDDTGDSCLIDPPT